MRHPLFAFLLLGMIASQAPAAERPLNVVLLLVDDWGWTDAGCCGSDLYQTPNIDRLAKDGIRFTHGYAACTVCSPTRAAIMSGKYPPKTGVTNWISGPTMKLRHEEVTIAEALKAAGYDTFHVGKWHLAPRGAADVEQYYPEHQGFDVNIAGNHWGAPASYFHPYRSAKRTLGQMPAGGETGDWLTDRLTDEALKLIDASKDKPFFLYFPYYAVHTPIMGKQAVAEQYRQRVDARGRGRHANANYAAMIQGVDESLGRIRDRLTELRIAERTLVILTGDNGGLDRRGNPTDNAPLRAGKGSAYEGGVRVPTFVAGPGVVVGAECAQPVISVDYYPTILELTGVKGVAEHNAEVDGVSIAPLLKDPAATLDRDAIYWHYPHSHGGGSKPHGAIRAGNWRLVRFYGDDHIELYDLATDVGEQNDLADKMPAKATQLRKQLDEWLSATGAKIPSRAAKKKDRG